MQIDRETLEQVEAALDGTRHLVAEAAGTGFNSQDGDWAERLYANNGTISAALARLRKAMEARMGEAMEEIGFRHILEAPADILSKPLTLLHWSGITERATLESKIEAFAAVDAGWTRYRIEKDHTND